MLERLPMQPSSNLTLTNQTAQIILHTSLVEALTCPCFSFFSKLKFPSLISWNICMVTTHFSFYKSLCISSLDRLAWLILMNWNHSWRSNSIPLHIHIQSTNRHHCSLDSRSHWKEVTESFTSYSLQFPKLCLQNTPADQMITNRIMSKSILHCSWSS